MTLAVRQGICDWLSLGAWGLGCREDCEVSRAWQIRLVRAETVVSLVTDLRLRSEELGCFGSFGWWVSWSFLDVNLGCLEHLELGSCDLFFKGSGCARQCENSLIC
ncbi:unnamed protein product [Prunus armeniaca]|uniref:Uncharacterized protein n=1 Tax=Prunus armeniaca TaxID=36596 RepID=A0A6J5W947_PRUAR|nr:unnamed protein product [Prunus armeniaca]